MFNVNDKVYLEIGTFINEEEGTFWNWVEGKIIYKGLERVGIFKKRQIEWYLIQVGSIVVKRRQGSLFNVTQ